MEVIAQVSGGKGSIAGLREGMRGQENPFLKRRKYEMPNSDHLHKKQHIGPEWFQEFIYNYVLIKHKFRNYS